MCILERASNRLRKFSFLAFALASFAVAGHAQDGGGDIAYVSPDLPDDPNLTKVAMLRLLYTGSGKAPTICLVREPQGQSPLIIEGNLSAGAITPYVPFRPERITLHIIKGDITELEKDPDFLKKNALASPLKVDLRPGSYQTLLVREKDGVLAAGTVPDTRPASGNAPVMRVLDMSGVGGWGVALLNQKDQLIRPLWKTGEKPSGISIPSPGIYRIQVVRMLKTGPQQMGMFETKLKASAPFTLVLYPGPTGEGAADLAFDANPGPTYNAEVVKALSGGTSTPSP